MGKGRAAGCIPPRGADRSKGTRYGTCAGRGDLQSGVRGWTIRPRSAQLNSVGLFLRISID